MGGALWAPGKRQGVVVVWVWLEVGGWAWRVGVVGQQHAQGVVRVWSTRRSRKSL